MKYDTETGSFAFVDVETSGGSAREDRIIEIAVITLDEGVVNRWSSLVDPDRDVPLSIRALTGIQPDMLQAAPSFHRIATEVAERLHGRLFVAHNARFDYGFVRAELARCGIHYTTRPLCTVRLSRTLFPGYRGFSLDALIKRFNLTVSARHRALPDAVHSLRGHTWYGPFFSPARAKNLLLQLAAPRRLCLILLGLEKRRPPCFGHQLGTCDGACIDRARGERMYLSLVEALTPYRLPAWPYQGMLLVHERDPDSGQEEAHVFYDWCHLGRAKCESELAELTEREPRLQFRADMFYLLQKTLRQKSNRFRKLKVLAAPAPQTWLGSCELF